MKYLNYSLIADHTFSIEPDSSKDQLNNAMIMDETQSMYTEMFRSKDKFSCS